jgi:hypothetical protein
LYVCVHGQVAQLVQELLIKLERAEVLALIIDSTGAAGRHDFNLRSTFFHIAVATGSRDLRGRADRIQTPEENTMNRRDIFSLSLITALGLALLPATSGAQQKSLKEQVVGNWMLVSTTNTATNGTKSELFGPNPKGLMIFESNGRFSQISMRADLPKFGTNNRATGTAEENKSVIQGSIAYFGTYSVNEADKSFTIQVEGATFPNWSGTAQKRGLSISGDELTFSNAGGSTGGSNDVKWKRVK